MCCASGASLLGPVTQRGSPARSGVGADDSRERDRRSVRREEADHDVGMARARPSASPWRRPSRGAAPWPHRSTARRRGPAWLRNSPGRNLLATAQRTAFAEYSGETTVLSSTPFKSTFQVSSRRCAGQYSRTLTATLQPDIFYTMIVIDSHKVHRLGTGV
jgi:hypothetical protein